MLTKIQRNSASEHIFAKKLSLFQLDVVFDREIDYQLVKMNFIALDKKISVIANLKNIRNKVFSMFYWRYS